MKNVHDILVGNGKKWDSKYTFERVGQDKQNDNENRIFSIVFVEIRDLGKLM